MVDPGPWASGPGEILRHALKLLTKDTDTNRRLAMILIDNAVELTLKTYLGLPSRVSGIRIAREKFREMSESFPKLLDAMEEHADEKLVGIDLGQVEWYHRLRNELYHQGNGLTVERQKVDVYAELAKLLFKNLFGADVEVEEDQPMERLGAFMAAWQQLEAAIVALAPKVQGMKPLFARATVELLEQSGGDIVLVKEYDGLRKFRNELVHGQLERASVTHEIINRVEKLTTQIKGLPKRE